MSIPTVTSAPLPQPMAKIATPAAQPAAAAPSASETVQTAEAPGLANLQAMLAAVRQSAAVRQDGLSVLMANVLRATATGNLPQALQSAVQQLMSLHLPTDKAPDAAMLRSAMLNSGLFTEAMLAAGNAPADLKTALATLNQAAQNWRAQSAGGEQPQVPSNGPSVPPPVAGARGTAQGPAAPTLPEGAEPAEIARLLDSGSDAALARNTLLQIASLPDANKPAETRWMFDVPLMTPQGAAVAQLVVERDGRNISPETPQPVWRVGLALNVEPLGPVRANLALAGEHAWVTISADRPESLSKLETDAGWLTDAFHASTLEADIAFQQANPPGAAGGGRRFVDRPS